MNEKPRKKPTYTICPKCECDVWSKSEKGEKVLCRNCGLLFYRNSKGWLPNKYPPSKKE